VNPATEQLTCYSEQELMNMTFLPFMHESTRELTMHHFRLAAQGTPQVYENMIVHKNGALIACRVTNMPIIVDGAIVGVYGIGKNINQRKQDEYQIMDSSCGLPR
jgi:two-component system, sporulation sensor kinase A